MTPLRPHQTLEGGVFGRADSMLYLRQRGCTPRKVRICQELEPDSLHGLWVMFFFVVLVGFCSVLVFT